MFLGDQKKRDIVPILEESTQGIQAVVIICKHLDIKKEIITSINLFRNKKIKISIVILFNQN